MTTPTTLVYTPSPSPATTVTQKSQSDLVAPCCECFLSDNSHPKIPITLIVFVAFLCDVSVKFLLRYTCAKAAGISYARVMRESFRKARSTLLQLCIMVTNLSVHITYLIIIGDVLSGSTSEDRAVHWGVLQEWPGGECWWNDRLVLLLFTLVFVFVLLPLLSLSRVGLFCSKKRRKKISMKRKAAVWTQHLHD